jgi:hypothetical protein
MKKELQRPCLLVLIMVLGAGQVRADGFPFPFGGARRRYPEIYLPKPESTPLLIETGNQGEKTRIKVPRALVEKLLPAAQTGMRSDGPPAYWSSILLASGLGLGLALFLALACARLVQYRPAAGFGLALVLVGVCLLGFGAGAIAHPPIGLPPPPPTNFQLSDQVTVEIVEEGSTIQLILNRNHPIHYRLD